MPYAGPSDAASTVTATRPPFHRRTRSSFSDERGPGAFSGLGHLPRLNRKAVFHINDIDDDNNDDDQPSYAAYPSSYSPLSSLSSLRLSINAGKFSPSVNPPPRIEIPPLHRPAAVPFPTSSPSSPSPGPAPFLSASSRTSSKPNSPSLPRTPSSPVILSNGKPLKSSLKSSISSPNISTLPIKHLRAQSAPSTPNTMKNVHFADKDSGLETIRVFNRTGKPASLSKPSGEETETETEAESSSYPFPVLPSTPVSASSTAALVYEIDTDLERTNPVPKVNPSPYANVIVETLALPRTRPPTLRGTILVRNMAFEKKLAVRFTLDEWQTTSEVMCKHVVSLPGLPPPFPRARTMGDVAGNIAAGKPAEDDQNDGPAWDRFSFTIRLEDYEMKLADRTLFLVARYTPGCGGEWWDNNDGSNYRVGFRRAAASPLPSPAIGIAHSQQRTFSAPSTLRTTPATGPVASPHTPATRQLASAPQFTRSFSSPFPTLGSASGREKMSEKGLGSPTAAYLSRKLSLSNYVAPSSQPSSMVTPPATPPGSVRLRSASLPTDVGLRADEPQEQPVQNVDKEEQIDRNCSPSPSVLAPPMLSPLSLIPGPSTSALDAQARSGYWYDGYRRPQLLSPPRSKESSPVSSEHASPRRERSPERSSKSALGLQVSSPTAVPSRTRFNLNESDEDDDDEDEDDVTMTHIATLSNTVRELGLNISPGASANASARVDTSDPSYAALLNQWCFAQSSPPALASGATSSPSTGSSAVIPVTVRGGDSTSKLEFGISAGYGFPGFSFGLPDVGMVGAQIR